MPEPVGPDSVIQRNGHTGERDQSDHVGAVDDVRRPRRGYLCTRADDKSDVFAIDNVRTVQDACPLVEIEFVRTVTGLAFRQPGDVLCRSGSVPGDAGQTDAVKCSGTCCGYVVAGEEEEAGADSLDLLEVREAQRPPRAIGPDEEYLVAVFRASPESRWGQRDTVLPSRDRGAFGDLNRGTIICTNLRYSVRFLWYKEQTWKDNSSVRVIWSLRASSTG